MSLCLIALGANIGEKEQHVHRAIDLLVSHDSMRVLRTSRIYLTEPVGGPQGQDSFANAAVLAETDLSPRAMLGCLLEIEMAFGRQRDVRWQARTLDLDLLLYDELTIAEEHCVLPHPRMSFRRFVLEPCAEIAAEMVHPFADMTIGQLLEAINGRPALISLRSEAASAAVQLAHGVCQKTKSVVFWPGQSAGEAPALAPAISEKRDLYEEFSAREQCELFFSREASSSAAKDTLPSGVQDPPYVICMEVAAATGRLEQHALAPRLAVAMLDCQQNSVDRLQAEAKRRMLSKYRGPFLVVDQEDLESAAIELIAAMEAMR